MSVRLVEVDWNDDDVEGRNSLGPDNAVLVMVLLDRGSDNSSDADAVAAHLHRAGLAVLVEHGCVHCVTVFTSELKDVTDFNSSSNAERAPARRAQIPGDGVA